jgi:hypothetical protein
MPVGIDIRVVAGGLHAQGPKRVARMTLVLSPSENTGGLCVELKNWPEQVAKAISGFEILVSPVKQAADRPGPDLAAAKPLAFRSRGLKKDDIRWKRINDAWRNLIAPAIGDQKAPWEALSKLIGYGSHTAADPVPAAELAQSVIAVPRGDIALFLSIWRARVVLECLRNGGRSLSEPACDASDVNHDWRFGPSAIDIIANLQTDRVSQLIKAAQAVAVKQFAARKKYLDASGRKDPIDALFELGPEQACRCMAPGNLLSAASLTKKEALDEILMRFMLLHDLSLKPDPSQQKFKDAFDQAAVALSRRLDEALERGKAEKKAVKDYDEAIHLQKVKDDAKPWKQQPLTEDYSAQSRLFAIQANPALARVFNFALDIEVDVDGAGASLLTLMNGALELHEADPIDNDVPDGGPITNPHPTKTHYLYLACRPVGGAVPLIWTTAKLRVEKDPPALKDFGHFLPCTREEIDIAAALAVKPEFARKDLKTFPDGDCDTACSPPRYILPAICDGAIRAFDGVIDLGAGRRHFDPAKRRPRYDLVSLESVSALSNQTELVRAQWNKASAENGKSGPAGPDIIARPTLATEGMVLVDRWHSSAVVFEFADAGKHADAMPAGAPIVLDATDLATGFRLDVGVRLKNEEKKRHHHWRTLCNRLVRYEYPKDKGLLEEVLKDLRYKAGEPERLALDGAPGMIPVKKQKDDKRRLAEEIVATWNGEPMGLQCRRQNVVVDPRQVLGISIDYDLPTTEKVTPPRLIFGKRYRFGLREVYLGGVVAPLKRAAAIYEEAAAGTLALPGATVPPDKWQPSKPDVPRIQGRRFLRHERLKAPTVLMPAGKELPQCELHPRDEARSVVLRTKWTAKMLAISGPRKAVRIVVAPGESQDFFVKHGNGGPGSPTVKIGDKVFLSDGLPNVDYTNVHGGFPVCKPKEKPNDEMKEAADTGKSQAFFKVTPTKRSTRAETRCVPYFPDPAARRIVIAVRRCRYTASPAPARDGDYLEGDPLLVDLPFGPKDAYVPESMASLYLEFNWVGTGDAFERKRRQSLVVDRSVIEGEIDSDGDFKPIPLAGWKEDRGTAPAKKVEIRLRPGEDFELDIWCCPTHEDLKRWFDIVESTAMLTVARGLSLGGPDVDQSCVKGLFDFVGSKVHKSVNNLRDALEKAGKDQLIAPECGAGGFALPCEEARLGIAQTIEAHLKRRPLREIAAVETMRMTHAVSRPRHRPQFMPSTPLPPAASEALSDPALNRERVALAVLRPNYALGDAKTIDQARRNFVARNPWTNWASADNSPGATELLVGGEIAVDLETTKAVTIHADMAHPRTSHLDDPRRTRTNCATALKKPVDDAMQTYGFRVDPEGRVSFPLQREVLLRLTNLVPSDDIGQRHAGNEWIDILTVPIDAVSPEPEGALMRPDLERCYVPDNTHARRMLLSLCAHGRFAGVFDSKTTKHETWSREADDHPPVLRFSDAAPDRGEVEIWIPATERPRPIDPKSIIPAFVWRETRVADDRGAAVSANQRTVVRLRFRRPWFSSGEGERLGVILGPPEIFDDRKRGILASLFGGPSLTPRHELESYVTRWGADPIGQGNVPATDYMPLEAFPDAFCEDTEAGPSAKSGAMRVPKVVMPLPNTELDEALAAGAAPTKNTVEVALLAFEPRFDLSDETWYVDVEIATGGVPNCFVRFGLVRYQPASLPGLEVSEPTTVMVQILPERDVRVRHSFAAGKDGADVIDVEVEGPAQVSSAEDDKDPIWHVPLMRPMLFYIDKLRSGPTDIRPADLIDDRRFPLRKVDKAEEGGFIMPRLGGKGLMWRHRFTLNPMKQLSHEQLKAQGIALRTFRVMLEEIEVRPLADEKKPAAFSGPRFAATIDLPGRCPPLAPHSVQ